MNGSEQSVRGWTRPDVGMSLNRGQTKRLVFVWATIRPLRAQGLGINKIARELRVGKSVVQRIANEMKGEANGASA